MSNFITVLIAVITTLFYMGCGFLIVKAKKGITSHAKTISGFLIYVCSPCLLINSITSIEINAETVKNCCMFFLITLVLQLGFLLLMYLILKSKMEDAKYRVLCIGSILGNVGFFALPVVSSIFPGNPMIAAYSAMYSVTMNIIVFTVGVYLITTNKKFISPKNIFFNPTMIAFYIAITLIIILKLTNSSLPSEIANVISLLGKMSTPLCMFVLGMRLASMNIKEIFCQPYVYGIAALKLIVFPLFVFGVLYFVPFDPTLKTAAYLLSAAPSASILLSLAEQHECEQQKCATAILVTTILTLITMPVLALLA